MQPAERHLHTADEYLELERRAETRSELVHGEIFAMAGGKPKHNALAWNVGVSLGVRLRASKSRCTGFTSDQRVHVEATGLYTYPDLTVSCGPRFHPQHPDTLLNPTVIVEVLSSSTEAYDRGAKFAHYQSIPGFAEYVLVSQKERRIEHYRHLESPQATEQWLLTVLQGDDAVLELPALGCAIPLGEIYAGTDELEGDEV
jgi:Uma2 family endonuclease